MKQRVMIPLALTCLAIAMVTGGGPGMAHAFEKVNVALLPFDINAASDQDYLRENLPAVLSGFLSQEGAEVLPASLASDADWRKAMLQAGGIRKFGLEKGADAVIWGSLTLIGGKISLDGRLISTTGTAEPRMFSVEGRGVENLSNVVKDLVRQMSLHLFTRERVARVEIAGNRRIEADAIRKVITTKPGDGFLAKSISEDLRAVYKMGGGYFEDIRVESEDSPDGKIVTFRVTEKPTIRRIRIVGNQIFEEKEIQETLTFKTGAILNMSQIQGSLRRIEALYKDKNYHNVKAAYTIDPQENNQADLEFRIEEGGKVRVKTIRFMGNKAYDEDDLKDLMKTSEKGFWSWITSSGDLKREDLQQDAMRLTSFYHNNGYIDAKVSDPEVSYEGDWIFVTIKIDEGIQYRVGKVTLSGDLVLAEDQLMKEIRIDEEKHYNREVIRGDVLKLTDVYADEGYAYADIAPKIQKDETAHEVNLTYAINKGIQVYFERVIISGNTQTRDKVIRRQLPMVEQGLYRGSDIKRGVRNLHRLDYFEDIKVNTTKGSTDDKMVLHIDVTEKPTGTFSFGGGYSSVDNLFFMASVTQRNLFGLGQILQLKAELGGSSNRFTLGFTEPWLFDLPLSAGFDIYKWEKDWDTYDRESTGANIRFGYPVWDFTRAYLTYRYDVGDIKNITEDASKDIWEMEGVNVTSSATLALRYDSRDKAFNPTEGGNHSLSMEYAGIGGDIGFTKYIGEVGQYFPLFWNTVGYLRARGGYVRQNTTGKLPDYEKFYMGGINSLRGFDWKDVSLLDEDGAQVGGYKFVQFNAEYIFPLIKDAGIMGVVFFDTGNVFDKSEDIRWDALRESCGAGFRWYSPMGPIRVEYGYILDPKEGEENGRWEFAMGQSF